jgi:hypothetical protein
MDDSGVTRDVVLRALRAKHYDVSVDQSGWWVSIAAQNRICREFIPPELGRRLVNRIVDRFGIPKQWLYEPLMIPAEDDCKPPN